MDCKLPVPSCSAVEPSRMADHLCFRRYMYTAGADGYVRVYDANLKTDTPFESKLIEYHDDEVTSISASVSVISACRGC